VSTLFALNGQLNSIVRRASRWEYRQVLLSGEHLVTLVVSASATRGRLTRSNSVMNVQFPVRYDAPGKASNDGMGRFFTSTNVDRYRRLAGNKIDTAERKQVFKVLSEEWSAFTREYRMHSVTPLRSSADVSLRSRGLDMTRDSNEAPDLGQSSHFFCGQRSF
jgi:hypothetical protein